MANRDKVLSLIGLAMKAGRCTSGEMMTENETKAGKAKLVVVASDASENTKKKFRDMCKFYRVPICFYGDKDTLGHAMGKIPCISGDIGRRICRRDSKRA